MNKKNSQTKIIYHYYNCNPKCRHTDDCVIRAICSSTGVGWNETMRRLAEHAIKTGYMINTPENYGTYLEERGYVRQNYPTHKDGTRMRFKEFAQLFDGHAVCLCGENHVTYVADNAIWDIWDVSNETVGDYWVYKTEMFLATKVGK